MLPPDKLKKAFEKVEEENWTFRAFLKGTEPDNLDKHVNELHKTLFAEMDCKSCQNCCKSISPVFNNKDIERVAASLQQSPDKFRSKYLEKVDGEMTIKDTPCPFLTEKGCSIYDCRPKTCREYPYTNKKDIVCRLINLVENCKVCPVVFEIFERLKVLYKEEYEEYKKEMLPYWDNLFGGKSYISY